MRVAGLAKVENIPGLENFDVTELVNGHMAYRAAMPKLLRKVGWEVESDEFTEIEDPDPENHEKRQRELIRELEDARKEAQQKPEKRRFGFFKRGKLAEKKGWETYDERAKESTDDFSTTAAEGPGANVLFDIEAIKKELESEAIEVKQLESTMPPIKLDSNGAAASNDQNPNANLRETKSYDDSIASRTKTGGEQESQPSVSNKKSQASNPFNKSYDEYSLSSQDLSGRPSSEDPKLSFEAPRGSITPSKDDPTIPVPSTPPQRPSLRTSVSSPASGGAAIETLDHNAWADEDDPDFGKEQDVQLTF